MESGKLILSLSLSIYICIAYAQATPHGDDVKNPVTLNDCQIWARENHPVVKQKELYGEMSRLRTENNDVRNLPQVVLAAQATYQSDVTSVHIAVPGASFPSVPKDQYKAYLDVRQNIWNGGLVKAGRIFEKARGKQDMAGVEAEVYSVRQQVNEHFFSSFLLQENINVLEKKRETLVVQRDFMEAGVKNGIVLQSDLDHILAELVRTEQQQSELSVYRETAVAALAILTGREMSDLFNLVLEKTGLSFEAPDGRPEFEFFGSIDEVLEASSLLAGTKRRPLLYGFGQAGLGRPGLNMFENDISDFYLVGIGLTWTVFDWKSVKRDRSIYRLQQELNRTRREEFERNVTIALDREYRQIARLENILKSDLELIGIRERITAGAGSKMRNGTITAADFIRDLNEEMVARITYETHKVELQAAIINYNTIIGDNR